MTRYIVGTVTGFLAASSGDLRRPPGVSAHVMDTVDVYRVLATYRSEDRGKGGGHGNSYIGRERALQLAHEHAQRLNEAERA